MINTPQRIDVPEGPARARLAMIYDTLKAEMAELGERARRAAADAGTQAANVLAGMGHDVSTSAAALRVEAGGVAVVLIPGETNPTDTPHRETHGETHDETKRETNAPSKPRVLRGRKGR